MTRAQLLVDGGHVLAAAGRAIGSGASRTAGAFDLPRLVSAMRALIPTTVDLTQIVWYDGVPPNGEPRELHDLRERSAASVVALPMRGGRQRHIEAAVLRDALEAVDRRDHRRLYLAADPRRHALAIQTVQESGCDVVLIGVSDGERTPAERIWLRRPDLLRAVARDGGTRAALRPGAPAYQRPAVLSSPVRLPLAARGVHAPREG